MKKEPMATPPVITNFPMNRRKSVTLSRTKARNAFRMSRKKASLADVQKFFPYTATMMYALRLINFINFSRHQKQHFIHQSTPFATGLSLKNITNTNGALASDESNDGMEGL